MTPVTPALHAADLQRRLRRLPSFVRDHGAFSAELDAIASEMAALSMRLEAYEPAGRVWRCGSRR